MAVMNQSNRVLLCSAFLALTVTYSGCAVNPVSGNREVVLLSVEGEKEIGAENAKQVKKEMGLFDDPERLKYVQSIGDRLARYSPYQEVSYQFQVIDSKEPNAFALPGGYVYVSRGLLVLLNSEDELAGVIGHEIGHVAARHGVQRLTRAAPIGLVTGITSAAVGIVSSPLANIVSGTGSLLNSAILAPYSRGQENDADEIGQELAAKAGWNPEGITLFLNTLDREAARNGNKNKGIPFLSTHPSTPDRIRSTEQRASEIEYQKTKPIANNQATFLAKLDGLIVGADARQGVVIGQDFLHPTMQLGMTFPAGWEIINHSEYIAATEKQQSAGLILQFQGEGTDADNAAQAFLKEAKLGPQVVKKITIAGLPASQIILNKRSQKASITFIAFRGDIYRLTAISTNSRANYQQDLEKSIATFHPLDSVEMAKIQQQRLRIVSAKSGESIAALLRRVDSVWDEESCAVANNLPADALLTKGQLVKVLKSEPFN